MAIHTMESSHSVPDPFLFPKKKYQDEDRKLNKGGALNKDKTATNDVSLGSSQDSDQKIDQFYQSIIDLIEENPAKYSNLLTDMPSFEDDYGISEKHSSSREDKHSISRNDKKFLLKFLRAGNYDCQVSIKILVNYILLIKENPKYYSSCLYPERIEAVFNEKIYCMLLHRDKFGRRVFIHRPGRWNPSNVSFTDCYCVTYMLCEMIALEDRTQITGCTGIIDGTNIGFKQLTSMGLEDIKNCAQFIQVRYFTCVMFMTFLYSAYIIIMIT